MIAVYFSVFIGMYFKLQTSLCLIKKVGKFDVLHFDQFAPPNRENVRRGRVG